MTTPTRQQSLEAARRAAHFLRLYIESQIVDDRLRAEIGCLLEEFERLDEREIERYNDAVEEEERREMNERGE
jgi:hypothetical protein